MTNVVNYHMDFEWLLLVLLIALAVYYREQLFGLTVAGTALFLQNGIEQMSADGVPMS